MKLSLWIFPVFIYCWHFIHISLEESVSQLCYQWKKNPVALKKKKTHNFKIDITVIGNKKWKMWQWGSSSHSETVSYWRHFKSKWTNIWLKLQQRICFVFQKGCPKQRSLCCLMAVLLAICQLDFTSLQASVPHRTAWPSAPTLVYEGPLLKSPPLIRLYEHP